ncbi:hypothetical protein EI94DRAFT_745842 [Lactarius quietus]|nr:hypothetical protein EI94DRAFT_745842 [Lactarius quietus]
MQRGRTGFESRLRVTRSRPRTPHFRLKACHPRPSTLTVPSAKARRTSRCGSAPRRTSAQ